MAIAAAVGLLALALLGIGRRPGRGLARLTGRLVAVIASVLAVGGAIGTAKAVGADRIPPPGQLIDVGGYRLHLLAEGDARGEPTVVWIPGGHAQGHGFYNFHKVFRAETRSILFDRAGTGWSDVGPFPRTTGREAVELATLLARAGERGPFVMIGHSYGGLLAANFARRFRDRTAAVVLLDPTPPDVLIYAPVFGKTVGAGLVASGERAGLAKLFGLWRDPTDRMIAAGGDYGRILGLVRDALADVGPAMRANDARPAGDFAGGSIFREFTAARVLEEAEHLMVYDGELQDVPVYLVIPADDFEASVRQMGIPADQSPRVINFLRHARQRYLATSNRGRLLHPPSGTGHNFPFEAPDFVVTTIRQVLGESRTPAGDSAGSMPRAAGGPPND